jgi:hypothetical protein
MINRLVALFTVMLSCSSVLIGARVPYPEVTLKYSRIFDPPCAELTKEPIDPEAVKELERRLGAFEEYWQKDAPALLGTVPLITGVPFRFQETRAALTLCRFSSMSIPLIVNMRPYVAVIAKEKITPLPVFSNTVFHEVLHRYVDDCIKTLPGATTPLLEKYASEPPVVRNHLHLYAIEHLVHQRSGRMKDEETAIADERRLKSGTALARAREIVAFEKAESFVHEIHNGSHRRAKTN